MIIETIQKRKLSDETRKKMSESHKGKVGFWKDKHRSKETNIKISLGNKGKKRSKKTRNRMSIGQKGKIFSEETREKLSLSHKGKHHSEETRKKLSILHKGEKCIFWKGGVSSSPYPEEWNGILRESIRCRDNYVCQECGIHQDELEIKLDVHHIDYNKDNLDPNNLVSLCKSCHSKTNFNRDYWIEYFTQTL